LSLKRILLSYLFEVAFYSATLSTLSRIETHDDEGSQDNQNNQDNQHDQAEYIEDEEYHDEDQDKEYPTSQSDTAPMRAHSFIDWMEGATEEEIAARPNRFVYISRDQAHVPDHMTEFVSGGYTDSEMQTNSQETEPEENPIACSLVR
jgi:hypothetical protein